MPIHPFPLLTPAQAVAQISPLRKFQMAAACYGKPLFDFGAIHFVNLGDLHDRMIIAGMKSRVHKDDFRGVLAPAFAAVTCVNQNDFTKLASVIYDRPYAEGRDLRVQVTGQDEAWHAVAADKIEKINRYQKSHKRAAVQIVQIDERRTDYVFPEVGRMRDFCEYIENEHRPNLEPTKRESALLNGPTPVKT